MAAPRWMAGLNRSVTNRLLGPLATRMPGFGVIVHTGRRSKRRYRTPVNLFALRSGYIVALTFGSGSDWVRNVMAATGCELETRGRLEHMTDPEIFHDESRRDVPGVIRPVLALLDVADFMRLTTDHSDGSE